MGWNSLVCSGSSKMTSACNMIVSLRREQNKKNAEKIHATKPKLERKATENEEWIKKNEAKGL